MPDMGLSDTTPLLGKIAAKTEPSLSQLNVYEMIHYAYNLVDDYINFPMTEEYMRTAYVMFEFTDPLDQLLVHNADTPALVYVLLLCRLQFLRERDSALASSSLNITRANMCETLAIRALRREGQKAEAGSDKPGNDSLLAMSKSLVGGLHAFQGASAEVRKGTLTTVMERVKQKEGFVKAHVVEGVGKTTALELAILGKARNFIKSQATQRVISSIWEGRVTYSSSSFIDILPDRWKVQKISLYNLDKAPVLDHYRLRVPKYRSLIDFSAFVVLFVSFIAVIMDRQNRHETLPVSKLSIHEKWFFLYALGFSLDKLASVAEHGFSIYAAGLTNGLDLMGIPIYAIAFGFRIRSILTEEAWASDQAYAVLSAAACLMFPRLAFASISNNLLILSLRAMLADFAWLLGIAVFCFLGFVFALNHLCDGAYSVARIAEWLIFIWFGLDGSGLDASPTFHPILGPVIIVIYAALSNTLLVSLLVAILSGTYASIAADAVGLLPELLQAAEDMFRKAVLTFEGVKADSLFDYVPPLNLIALLIMWPVSHVTNPRWFHKINVASTRIASFPILLAIAFYERQSLPNSPLRRSLNEVRGSFMRALPAKWSEKISLLEGAHWECAAVFEYTPDGVEDDEDINEPLPGDEEDAVDYRASLSNNGANDRPRLSSRASGSLGRPLSRVASSSAPTPPAEEEDESRAARSTPMVLGTEGRRNEVRFTESPPSSSPPASPRKRHDSTTKERLPLNAYGTSGRGRRPSLVDEGALDSATSGGSALSTSTPNRYDSPLARMMSYSVEGPPSTILANPRHRRHSGVGLPAHATPMRVNTMPFPGATSTFDPARESGSNDRLLGDLIKMVAELQRTVESLEKKVEGKMA
ncbi:BZ3500_MvSof-1268-A1-R1_Chr1-3g02353 [Microbotryum saponariae]|uniref:BZ3500_MvSof-1268-A1-R1_Chr1-3g02353 protein n=1 Tax=Microbotryum saponariae TaxID=289078 RepID=A0A2X0M9X1_9BASI|nr:BZ3500_MvSof-1268-A1-R1_Chr1-3g02353 [Microbotryum saponariae]SCZ96080.1 BZ3501_MvSof-1269-A2-R1_Chr1-3g01956 [Microbotryum saponariae]